MEMRLSLRIFTQRVEQEDLSHDASGVIGASCIKTTKSIISADVHQTRAVMSVSGPSTQHTLAAAQLSY